MAKFRNLTNVVQTIRASDGDVVQIQPKANNVLVEDKFTESFDNTVLRWLDRPVSAPSQQAVASQPVVTPKPVVTQATAAPDKE